MSVRCDGCGTAEHVRRAFVTVWNGNVLDLCRRCQEPFAKLIDAIWFSGAQDAVRR